jgi:hypothetical protein
VGTCACGKITMTNGSFFSSERSAKVLMLWIEEIFFLPKVNRYGDVVPRIKRALVNFRSDAFYDRYQSR